MTRFKKLPPLLLVLFVLSTACTTGDVTSGGISGEPFPNDAWYRPMLTDSPYFFGSWSEIKAFGVVPENKQKEAFERLENSSWQKLSNQEAQDFLGKVLEGNQSDVPVLLRALSLNEANGNFYVSWQGGIVMVNHNSLGSRYYPQTRRAIVAWLPGVPKEVFVGCSMAR
ncbi:MAG: hypothetical protein ACJ8F7_07840 [Gemmataceae bacterium]